MSPAHRSPQHFSARSPRNSDPEAGSFLSVAGHSRRRALRRIVLPALATLIPDSGRAQQDTPAEKAHPAPGSTGASTATDQPRLLEQTLPDTETLQRTIASGFTLLDKRYWSPEISIWLDRPGNDLRAFYEGRLNPPWWSCANAVETLADYMTVTRTSGWKDSLTALHRRHRDNADLSPTLVEIFKKRGQWTARDAERRERRPRIRASTKTGFRDFNNEYLDDSGWWGLAWLKMHRLTGDPAFLETARAIQRHMAAHRVEDGGIVWNLEHQPPVTNAISNGLFLTLSARLHAVTGETSLLDEARRTHGWYLRQKLWDGTGIVDGPGHQGDYWSYNQGMWILGLLALGGAEKTLPARQDEAAVFTGALLDKAGFLTAEGVLTEKLSQTGWDTALFKGVLARALGALRDSLRAAGRHPELAARVDLVLRRSAASLLLHSRSAESGEYGLQWQPRAEKQEWNFNTQLSALTALTAVLS